VILLWQELRDAIAATSYEWAANLREEDNTSPTDAAFAGRFSLLNTDQGVRAVLAVANDLCFVSASNLGLDELESDEVGNGTSEAAISSGLTMFRRAKVGRFLRDMAQSLASYDWCTSGTPGLSEAERSSKARFRGGTGYRELRSDLLHHLAVQGGVVADAAAEVADALRF
jgi:hypothetical protein